MTTHQSFESLHTHTALSDGKLSHKQMFELSEFLNISVIAYTDHDVVLNEEALAYLESVRSSKTKWISGIEISSAPPKEIEGLGKGGLHIVGLFVDPRNEALREHCRKAQVARIERMQKIVSNLHAIGFTVSEEDCLRASGGESVGRPHVVEALNSHPENEGVIKNLTEEMKRDALLDKELNMKYEAMINGGAHQLPYSLFLSRDAYRPAYADVSYSPDLDETVALIRNAGGIALIAHYFTVKKKMPFPFIEKLLAEKRIDGMETVYGLWHVGKNDEAELETEKGEVRELLKKYGALESGGPDAHTEEDIRQYANLAEFAAPSVGMTEKILASGKAQKIHSSF
jgi:predicted metal-dependent phosphoesterase TrpH